MQLSRVWGLSSLCAREWSWTEAKASEVSKLPCHSESVGQRAWAGLWSHGFQVSSPGWVRGIADFRLTLQLGRKCGRVVGKWLGFLFLKVPSWFKCPSRTEGHCIKLTVAAILWEVLLFIFSLKSLPGSMRLVPSSPLTENATTAGCRMAAWGADSAPSCSEGLHIPLFSELAALKGTLKWGLAEGSLVLQFAHWPWPWSRPSRAGLPALTSWASHGTSPGRSSLM